MRTSESKCLLCLTNLATKTNSHIVPKFLSKPLFSTTTIRRAYEVGHPTNRIEFSQDSPKENYILCPACEAYFSELETKASSKVFNVHWKETHTFFEDEQIGPYNIRHYTEIDPKLFHLFLMSVIWRCSVSSVPLFRKFQVDLIVQEELRFALNSYKPTSDMNLHTKLTSTPALLPPLKYFILSKKHRGDPTDTVLSAVPTSEPYIITLCEFQLVFSRVWNQKQLRLDDVNSQMSDQSPIRIVRYDKGWEAFMEIQMKNIQKFSLQFQSTTVIK